ncbi:hypothetical protein [Streptomyces marianii]|uniref:Inorganic polyphosphate kinase n=1 Tax=Streptomyces marianii TaxID=1817406 RepID=A0A5R9E1X3_9ACTN|nr:hypothetical protein [Streptomyces marianii]TLQ43045.1 hypothetical protein FEF34_07685 [Streptomyces marianii]
MSLAPRAVVVHRTTEYEELLARHGTHGQAEFFLASRGRSVREVAERHRRTRQALAAVSAAVPARWRRARVERSDLDRFLFAPGDVVVVAGQDGLVANTAKYLSGQPVVGIDTDPGRNTGVLVRHLPGDTGRLLRAAVGRGATTEELTMVEAVADDTQRLVALNEIYLGRPDHQTSRYRLELDGGRGGPAGPARAAAGGDGRSAGGAGHESDGAMAGEAQASSGVLVGTGTGATGWLRSLWRERGGGRPLPAPGEARLLWFVREAWSSPATGTSLVDGDLSAGRGLRLTVECDRLVAFGDGMESDALELTWGQSVRVGVSDTSLRLLV